jgi:hypothetical protein
MNLNALNLFAAEALEIHRVLDVVNVPRAAGEERLSMSERVAVLVDGYLALQATKLVMQRAATA